MNKIQSIWHIKKGKLEIEKKQDFQSSLYSLPDGKYFVEIEKAYNKRSSSQHNALFGIPYKMIAERMSDIQGKQISVSWVHDFCKDNNKNQLNLLPLGYEERIREEWEEDPFNRITNDVTGQEITLPFVPTTKKMSTVDCMEYYKNLQEFGREWLDIEIPDPDPNYMS